MDLAAWYRTYGEAVLRRCRRLSDGDAQARDLLQDVFLRAHRYRHTYRGGSPLSWLLTIADRVAYRALQQERRAPVDDIAERMKTLRVVGVPYTDEMIEKAKADLEAQINPDSKAAKELVARYPKAQVRKFDGAPDTPATELDAMIAYLQMLGTLVDFTSFDAAGPNLR